MLLVQKFYVHEVFRDGTHMHAPGTGEKLVQELRSFEALYFILNRQP
jgi:hypothetical protein